MECNDLFSLKSKRKLECRLLKILLGALRVNGISDSGVGVLSVNYRIYTKCSDKVVQTDLFTNKDKYSAELTCPNF